MAEGDARFEDAPLSDRPLRLKAEDAEDLAVVSSLTQDAVARVGDIRWMARRRRLVLLMNRFRWEDADAARREHRPFERVRSALTLEGVSRVRARGFDMDRPDGVIGLLSVAFEPGADGAGTVTMTFAGGAELGAEVEILDASLADLTRPWEAQSRSAPGHGD